MLTYGAVLDAILLGVAEVKGAVATVEVSESTSLLPRGDMDDSCLDFDSLDLLELVVFIEERFGWEINEDYIDADSWHTVGDLAAMVMNISAGTLDEIDR